MDSKSNDDDDDRWSGVENHPSGVTDTLLQEYLWTKNLNSYHVLQFTVDKPELTTRKEQYQCITVLCANGNCEVKIEELPNQYPISFTN